MNSTCELQFSPNKKVGYCFLPHKMYACELCMFHPLFENEFGIDQVFCEPNSSTTPHTLRAIRARGFQKQRETLPEAAFLAVLNKNKFKTKFGHFVPIVITKYQAVYSDIRFVPQIWYQICAH